MRCSGFVMTDESGKVLAVSVDGSADLVKSLAGGKVAPETPAEMVAEHERLVDVLRSPSHEDDLEEADRQEAELAEYRKQAGEELSKAHVRSYTRKDGTFVKEHDDNRQAAQPEQPSARPAPAQAVNALADKHREAMVSKGTAWNHDGVRGKKVPAADVAGLPEFSHKEVYGHDGETSPAGSDFAKPFADKGHQGFVLKHPNGKRSFVDTQGYGYARYHAPVADAPAGGADAGGAAYDHPNVVGRADFGGKSPEKHYAMKFAGTEYIATGKTGNSMHDQTPVREFEAEDGHRVWADHAGRVHADSKGEVAGLRKRAEAHGAQSGQAKAGQPKAGGYVAPKEGEVGHHEHTQYGAFFRPGDKVRDGSGKEHEVMEHRGAEVKTYGGGSFHPTKLTHVSSKAGGEKPAPAGEGRSAFKRGDKVKVHKPGQLSHGVEGSVIGPSKTKPDHVSIKTLDGKLVSHHKDDLVPAAKPEAGKHTTASLSLLADQHVAEAQRHERLSSKKGADHQDYEHHVVASALHSKAQRHAEKAAEAADGSPERDAHLQEYRRLKGMIERREDAIGESGKPMAKALLFVPVGGAGDLIEATKPFVRQVGDQ